MSSDPKLSRLIAARVNQPARLPQRSASTSCNELYTDIARARDSFTVLFSLRGERFTVTVPAKNYTDAKRLAWIDAREILEPSDFAALVLCQCSRTPLESSPLPC